MRNVKECCHLKIPAKIHNIKYIKKIPGKKNHNNKCLGQLFCLTLLCHQAVYFLQKPVNFENLLKISIETKMDLVEVEVQLQGQKGLQRSIKKSLMFGFVLICIALLFLLLSARFCWIYSWIYFSSTDKMV